MRTRREVIEHLDQEHGAWRGTGGGPKHDPAFPLPISKAEAFEAHRQDHLAGWCGHEHRARKGGGR